MIFIGKCSVLDFITKRKRILQFDIFFNNYSLRLISGIVSLRLLSDLACLTVSPPVEANTKTQSLRSILDHFTNTRNVYVDPVAKQRARDVIVNMFNDHGLLTWTEGFPSNQEKVNKIMNSLHNGK